MSILHHLRFQKGCWYHYTWVFCPERKQTFTPKNFRPQHSW